MNRFRFALVPILVISAGLAHAQNTIDFSVDVSQADGQATPTLTWSTSPTAQSCVASGDWTGSKGPVGSETQATIDATATYNLTCTWGGDSTATLSWTNPTQNTNGTSYDDADSTRIEYGLGSAFDQIDIVGNPLVTSRTITGLTPGQWCFRAFAINQRGVASAASNEACKTVTGDVDVQESVGVIVNPVPNPITNLDAT